MSNWRHRLGIEDEREPGIFPCSICERSFTRRSFTKNQFSKGVLRKCPVCLADLSNRAVQRGADDDADDQEFCCVACNQALLASQFTVTQLRKRDPKCLVCCGATGFSVTGSAPFANGSSRVAWLGTARSSGEQVVIKQFVNGAATEKEFWQKDVNSYMKADEFARRWNTVRPPETASVRVTLPYRAYIKSAMDGFAIGEWVLVEEFIGGAFTKWNSNSGYVRGDAQALSIQAFCHFTFHDSDGRLLLCDAQGVKDDDYVVTDPCVMSVDQSYGICDLGYAGIQQWFAYHRCNNFCSAGWRRPPPPRALTAAVPSSTYRSDFLASLEGRHRFYSQNMVARLHL